VFAFLDLADVLAAAGAALCQTRERVGTGNQRGSLLLEQIEEIALLRNIVLIPVLSAMRSAIAPIRRAGLAAARNSRAPKDRMSARRSSSSTALAASARENQRRSR